MLSRAAFGCNSNFAGLNCEKSRSDKSCSRKASASSSVVILGTLRFIVPDRRLPKPFPDSEGCKQRASPRGAAYGDQPILEMGVLRVGRDSRLATQKRLDLGNGNA